MPHLAESNFTDTLSFPMNQLLAKGKTKAIGVSNMSQPFLEELSKTWVVPPAANQVTSFVSRIKRILFEHHSHMCSLTNR